MRADMNKSKYLTTQIETKRVKTIQAKYMVSEYERLQRKNLTYFCFCGTKHGIKHEGI